MKRKIKNLIFDFGNVIVDLDRKGMVSRFAEQGVDVDKFTGISAQKGIFGDLELGRVTPDDFCKRLTDMAPQYQLEGTALTLTPQGIKDAWNTMLAGIPERRLKALQWLGQHYHISLLSNTNQIHVDYSFEHHFRVQGYEPNELFEHIFLSNELHLAKPERTIFDRVLQLSGYKAEETLFIDDSAINCQAFSELGVHTLVPHWADEWLYELCPSVATIGFFDGVHRGHRYLIERVKAEAAERGMNSMAITFAEHPRAVLHSDYIPQLLTSPEEKRALLNDTGLDHIEMLHFTETLSHLSAKEYMERVLRNTLGVKVLVMGYDHRFGHGGGTWEEYQAWGREVGIEVLRAEAMPEAVVSSSVCRRLITDGKMSEAATLLGHPYTLQGCVIQGHQVGHELGFPTANLQQFTHKLLPANGVYAVWAELEDGTRYRGMLNIGQRPTINNGEKLSIEVNLLDFEGDLYGHNITLYFIERLREEKRFCNREELIEQIKRDKEQVEKI